MIARPPRIEKERRCAKVDEKTRCIPSIYRFESENRFGEIASNRRDRDAREREREAIVQREIRILLFTFALPRDNGGKRSPRFERRRQGVGRGERKGREREKNGPLAMPIFIPSSIVERENDPSLPLLQFEARLRVGSSSS